MLIKKLAVLFGQKSGLQILTLRLAPAWTEILAATFAIKYSNFLLLSNLAESFLIDQERACQAQK